MNKLKESFQDFRILLDSLIEKENIDFLFLAIIGFSSGVSISYSYNLERFYFSIIILSLICLSLLFKKYKFSALFLFLIIGFFRLEYSNFKQNDILKNHKKNIHINGNVINILKKQKSCFVFFETKDLSSYKNYNSKIIRLKTSCDNINFKIGDKLKVSTDIFSPKIKFKELEKDLMYYMKYNKIYAYGNLKSSTILKNNSFSLINRIKKFRFNEINRIHNRFSNEAGYGFIISILMGNSYLMNEVDISNIRHIGIAHIIAISGLHMSVMLFIFYYGIRRSLAYFPKIVLYYDTQKIAAILSITFCYFYLALSGYSISATRSFIMISITLLSVFFYRKNHSTRSLYLSFLIISFFDPFAIFHPSFQLSFIAVLSLISFHKYFNNNLDIFWLLKRNNKIYSWFFTILLTEFATTFATLFFEMYHFGQFVLLGMFSNFIIIPFVEFIILPVSFLGLIVPIFGDVFYFIAIKCSNILLKFASFFVKIPFVFIQLEKFNEFELIISLFGLLILLIMKTKLRFSGLILIIFSFYLYFIRPKPILMTLNENLIIRKEHNICSINKRTNNFYLKSIENYMCLGSKIIFNETTNERSENLNCCIIKNKEGFEIIRKNKAQNIIPFSKITNKMFVIYQDCKYKIFK